MDKPHDINQNEYNSQLFGVRRSIRYHTKRMHFFSFVSIFMIFLFVGGSLSAAFFAITHNNTAQILFAFLAFFAAVINVIAFSNAQIYNRLMKQFATLEKEFVKVADNITGAELSNLINVRLDIEAEEPKIKTILNVICHNELATAMGYPKEDRHHLTNIQRWLSHFVDIGVHKL